MAAHGAVEAAIQAKGYAHPEALVTTQWVADHLDDPNVRLVESNEDVLLYDLGHIPGVVKIDWQTDLQDPVIRDYLDPEAFARLASSKGIGPDTTVVFYGDKNNWWACYAFWVFKLFGHRDCRIMDGGRALWEAEGRPLVREVPQYPETAYPVPSRQDSLIRAFREDVEAHTGPGSPWWTSARRTSTLEEAAHARVPPGGGPAGRPHPRGSECALGPGGPGGRHLQDARRSCGRSTWSGKG